MYRKWHLGVLKHVDFIFLDALCLECAFLLSYYLRHYMLPFSSPLYTSVFFLLPILHIVVSFFLSDYKGILRRGYYAEFRSVLSHVTMVTLLLSLYLFVIKDTTLYSRLSFITMYLFFLISSYATHCAWKHSLRTFLIKRKGNRALLLITSRIYANDLVRDIQENNLFNLRLIGLILTDGEPFDKKIAGIPVVCDIKQAKDYICHNWVDEVMIDSENTSHAQKDLIAECITMGITVHRKIAALSDMTVKNQHLNKLAGCAVLTESLNSISVRQAFFKRAMDICGGLVGCFISAIFFLVLAPIIYIADPGPIFFAQERIGRNGKRFRIYKFRSMYLNAEDRKAELMKQNKIKDGMMFKLDKDPRIIPGVGHFIRSASLDEWPQFLNVLKGDMSLVGTRPPTIDEWEKYQAHHRVRMAMRPGITGMWQVSGRSKITDFEAVVKLDREYVNRWSFGLDVLLLGKTVVAVVKRDGAA
ncbi:galactosyl transferase [Clostridia bacterium]|nr:galactosyl transferase [Clostridia bacterium]